MDQQQYTRWRAIRAKGQINYFLTAGVLKIGIPFSIGTALIGYLIRQGLSWPTLDALVVLEAVAGLIFGAAFCGLCFTLLTWYWTEDAFLEYQQNLKSTDLRNSPDEGIPTKPELA